MGDFSSKFILNLGMQLNVERSARIALELRVTELEIKTKNLEEKFEGMERREGERNRQLRALAFGGGEE